MAQYILAHDLGTSGNKASLFLDEGKLMGSKTVSYGVHYFGDNCAEQNPQDWWRAVCDSTKALLEESKVDPKEIKTVSFSGQMMGCLCVDADGNPLRSSIIWADQRAKEQAKAIEEHISQEEYYKIVGHRNVASYGIQKLMWVRDHEPEIYAKTYRVLNAKDYIVFCLTGEFCTEYSDANSMGCFDLKNLCWSEKLMGYAGIDMEKLPKLHASTYVAGEVTKEAAKETGLCPGTTVVLGAGDGVAANVGAGSVKPGKSFCCLGTSAWVATTTEKPVFDESMRTVCWAHAVPGCYSPNATMQYAGGSYSWFKKTFCEELSYQDMDKEIASSPAGSNGVIFLPYLLGERAPRWNPKAKGAFVGMDANTSRADMIRSVLEGVTMNLNVCLDIIKKQCDIPDMLAIGGGAKGAQWRQIMADIYQIPVQVPVYLEEANSMGAAVIGGVGSGIYKDFDAIDRFLDISSVVMPRVENSQVYASVKELFNSCYDNLVPVYAKM